MRRPIVYLCLVSLTVVIMITSQVAACAQSRSGVVYITAAIQEQAINLFDMTAIAPKPGIGLLDQNKIRGDAFVKNFFAPTIGYHFTHRWRADVGYHWYTSEDKENGTYTLRKGSTYIAQHTIRTFDIPIQLYYNMRNPASTSKWIWYGIASISYTNIRWKRYFEVVNGSQPRSTQENRHFDNVFLGIGAGLRYELTRTIEPYYHLDFAWGTIRGAFKANVRFGVKLNLNINHPLLLI